MSLDAPPPPPLQSPLLDAYVGALLARIEPLEVSDSLQRAVEHFRGSGRAVLAVVDGPRYVGTFSEAQVLQALGEGRSPLSSVGSLMPLTPPLLPLRPYMTGAAALRALADSPEYCLPVVDDMGVYQGLVTPSDLFPRRPEPPIPRVIGGMATPFGVYLTNGVHTGGVGTPALMATGAMLFGLFMLGTLLGYFAITLFEPSPQVARWIFDLSGITTFLVGLRLLPLSGIHGAEHKVVHAIERGEPLAIENVRRMPRIHPRCGTNLAVGATLFFALANWNWTSVNELRLLVALIATLMLWRPLGMIAQRYVTTRTPNEKQLMMGISSGKELVDKMLTARRSESTIGMRLLRSGIFQIMAGAIIFQLIVMGLVQILPVPETLRVLFSP